MFSRSLIPLALVLAAGACLPAVAGAATGSALVFIQDGDVWRVAPDGSGAHALTTDGMKDAPYGRPRLAPDGSVWALKGYDVVHLGEAGAKLGSFTPPRPKDSEGIVSDDAPEFLDLSPDGTKLAYGVENIRCADVGPCNTDGITLVLGTDGTVIANQVGISESAFADDATLVGNEGQFEGTLRHSSLTGPSALWYDDSLVFGVQPGVPREPVLSTDGRRMAALRTVTGVGVGVFTYTLPERFGTPDQVCVINNVLPTGASPAYSPDGTHLAVAQKDGLAIYDMSAITQPSECKNAKVVTGGPAGASQPDWGPVPVPDPPVQHQDTPPAQSQPAPPAPAPAIAPGPKPAQAPAAAITIASQRLGAVLKKGLRVKLVNVADRTTVTVSYKGKKVGTGKTRAGKATIKLSSKALKQAKRATVIVTAGAATRTVTLIR
jgi:hypothetical protein